MALEITDSNYKELLAGEKPLVIDFWATWCGPCRMVAPIIEELANEYAGKVVIGKYNVENDTEVAAEHGILSIPTVLFFKGGKVVDKVVGAVPKAVYEDKVKALLA